MSNLRNAISELRNILGWKTNRKILILESDDWGSERFPDIETRERFIKDGFDIKKCGYSMYDCFENRDDLEGLFNVLTSFKDINGNHAKFSLFLNVANPDYEKIKASNFQTYYYEPISRTATRYLGADNIIDLYQSGTSDGLVDLQYHGREHLYVERWLRSLKNGKETELYGFKNRFFGFSGYYAPEINKGYRAAFDLDEPDDIHYQGMALRDGLKVFRKEFGKSATSFVAPDGPFNNKLESILHDEGVRFIGAARMQIEPYGDGKTKRRIHYLGQKNRYNQIYITRSGDFDPMIKGEDVVNNCLKQIDRSFRWRQPAIISTHRANFVGGIEKENRFNGVLKLKELLDQVIVRWPEVEFFTTEELGNIIAEGK